MKVDYILYKISNLDIGALCFIHFYTIVRIIYSLTYLFEYMYKLYFKEAEKKEGRKLRPKKKTEQPTAETVCTVL